MTSTPISRKDFFVLMGILTVAFIVRIIKLVPDGLWYDELQSVTFAIQDFSEVIKVVREFDQHPPIYYLQLHFWLHLGTNDIWIRLNSVFWSMLTIISLWFTTRRIFSLKSANIAAALLAVSPHAVFHANNVRMYVFMSFLGIWIWYFTYNFFSKKKVWINGLGLTLLMLIFLYSHGTGFLILFATTAFAILSLAKIRSKLIFQRFVVWGILQILIISAYIPWLFHAQSIKVGHTVTPSLKDIGVTLSQILFGHFPHRPEWLGGISLVIFVLISIWILWFQQSESCPQKAIHENQLKIVYLAFVLTPILATIAISYIARPIWIERSITFTHPFIFLGLGIRISYIQLPIKKPLSTASQYLAFAGMSFFILFFALIHQHRNFESIWAPRNAVNYLQETTLPDDTVVLGNPRTFWAWCWYAVAPNCINPLIPNYELIDSKGLKTIYTEDISQYSLENQILWFVNKDIDNSSTLNNIDILERETMYQSNRIIVEKILVTP